MKKIRPYFLFAIVIAFSFSCTKRSKNDRGLEYMADLDMYYSHAVKAYVPSTLFENQTSALLPVEGSVPRGKMPYLLPNTIKAYEFAGKNLKNPLEQSEKNLEDGAVLFQKFCTHCHGEQGKGDGKLVQLELYGGVPDYTSEDLKDLPEGKIFHSITHGKNSMGSHAGQLSIEERWKLVLYVQNLQKQ